MLTAGKFLSGSITLGALTVLGSALLQVPSAGHPAHLQGPLPSAILAQSACDRVNAVYLAASTQISPSLRSFVAAASFYVSTNATTARLQLEGMENAVVARLSLDAWLPSKAPNLRQIDLQGASNQTRALATRMPVVKAVQTDMNRFVDLKPAFDLAPGGF